MPSPQIERKLAAIMFTDIAGYTALSAKDSKKTSELLKTQRGTLKPIVEKHGGSWMKEMGDGLLLTFDSATSAVECSIAIQEATKEIEDLNLRIGIHEGEVIKQDGDVLGDDVNVAARIEPFSAEGGVAISQKVQQAISSNTEFETKYIGKPKLKGVSQEVKVYCIISHGLPQTDLSKVSAKLEKESNLTKYALIGGVCILVGALLFVFQEEAETIPSIAIIPLENKGESKDEFYSYSISADLISDVSSTGDIRVVSLKDVEKLDYKSLTNSEIAEKLFVRYISQGTLWKVDSIFQLSMELYDTKKDKIEWSNNWQQNWSELPSIKGGLSENILNNLQVTRKQDITKSETQNTEAYEWYLKAKSLYQKRKNKDDIENSRELLQKAINADPKLNSATSLLVTTYLDMGDVDKVLDIYTLNLKYAEQIGDSLLIAQSLREIGHYQEDNMILNYYNRALQIFENINQKDEIISTQESIGNFYRFTADYDNALEYYELLLSKRKKSGDKRGIANNLINIGHIYSLKNNYEKAIEYYKRSLIKKQEIGNKREIASVLMIIGGIYAIQNKITRALDYLDKFLIIAQEIEDNQLIFEASERFYEIYYNLGNYDKALAILENSLLLAKNNKREDLIGTVQYKIGNLFIQMGDFNKAKEYLEKSILIARNLNDYWGVRQTSNIIGILYMELEDYEKALEYLVKSRTAILKDNVRMREMNIDNILLNITCISLINKNLDKEYDVKEIYNLIKELENSNLYSHYKISLNFNYYLYQLLEDKAYLETAYNHVQEKASAMDEKLGKKFLSYPIPKAIVEEWEKVK